MRHCSPSACSPPRPPPQATGASISASKVTAADAEPEFGRTFHNHAQAVPAGLGRVLRDHDEDSEALTGVGLLLGYRRTFDDGLFLEAELDVAVHGGTARGRLPGVGVSPGRDQAGESWPYRWRFEKDRSFGLTLRLGGNPAFLHALAGADSSLYLLAGVRRARTAAFGYRSRGCTLGGGCTDDQYIDGDPHWDFYQTGWSFGGGMEVFARCGLRATRRTPPHSIRKASLGPVLHGYLQCVPAGHAGDRTGARS